ncbi:uncharacterized protein IUM83_12827 [Phytophthora cinnamomi]|uniref:uncharacterized protein n=1 Tax=Phytophthora cinnamomi TaxID=4785 RepID=UPI003559D590|nr:hypothetical protein IUM83_12827 [Phytophthora cinnamomi]
MYSIPTSKNPHTDNPFITTGGSTINQNEPSSKFSVFMTQFTVSGAHYDRVFQVVVFFENFQSAKPSTSELNDKAGLLGFTIFEEERHAGVTVA